MSDGAIVINRPEDHCDEHFSATIIGDAHYKERGDIGEHYGRFRKENAVIFKGAITLKG